jgi:hypothetical protein
MGGKIKRFGVRNNDGLLQVIWIERTKDGFWRGIRMHDGAPSRGPLVALLQRFHSEREAEEYIDAYVEVMVEKEKNDARD